MDSILQMKASRMMICPFEKGGVPDGRKDM